MSFRIYMADCTNVLLREIASKESRQKDIALTYAFAIKAHTDKEEEVDWPKVNAAILERWSEAGLDRIKRMAWARFDPQPKA